MSYLKDDDKEYFGKKLKKFQYENKILKKSTKNNKEKLKSLLEIKNQQREALEKIFDYLNNHSQNNELSSSQLEEIRQDELEILKELEYLTKLTNKLK